jgi:alcohol dehydrogenase
MRALVAARGERLRWRSIAAPPAPGPHGAVVHPIAVATCDLDRALILGRTPFPLPLCIGHECVAEVLAVGGPAVLDLVATGRLAPEQVTTDLAELDDAPRALAEHARGDATKTILTRHR